MTPEELFELHKKLSADALHLMESKNHDYRGGSGDPFANFRASQNLGIEPELGILIRMSDKLARIATFIHKGTLKVKDEGVRDTILDLINYSVLLQGMINDKKVWTHQYSYPPSTTGIPNETPINFTKVKVEKLEVDVEKLKQLNEECDEKERVRRKNNSVRKTNQTKVSGKEETRGHKRNNRK